MKKIINYIFSNIANLLSVIGILSAVIFFIFGIIDIAVTVFAIIYFAKEFTIKKLHKLEKYINM